MKKQIETMTRDSYMNGWRDGAGGHMMVPPNQPNLDYDLAVDAAYRDGYLDGVAAGRSAQAHANTTYPKSGK